MDGKYCCDIKGDLLYNPVVLDKNVLARHSLVQCVYQSVTEGASLFIQRVMYRSLLLLLVASSFLGVRSL